MPLAIVTDSTACIPTDLSEELNIHSVPYYIHRGAETLRDLVTIDRKSFYDWLPKADVLPKTASPGPGDYVKLYKTLADSGEADEIISIHMTSKGSGAFQAAVAAKTMLAETLPKLRITVIDTLNVSMCHGWMVIEAARASIKGANFNQVVDRVQELIPISRMIQTADTLKYLYMGGRIGRAKQLLGSLLNIKPLISMVDGIITPVGIARSRKQAYRMMVSLVERVIGIGGKIKVAYVHAAALEEALKIKALIDERFQVVESIVTELTPALGVHTGPGTAGICYFPVV